MAKVGGRHPILPPLHSAATSDSKETCPPCISSSPSTCLSFLVLSTAWISNGILNSYVTLSLLANPFWQHSWILSSLLDVVWKSLINCLGLVFFQASLFEQKEYQGNKQWRWLKFDNSVKLNNLISSHNFVLVKGLNCNGQQILLTTSIMSGIFLYAPPDKLCSIFWHTSCRVIIKEKTKGTHFTAMSEAEGRETLW